MLNQKIRVLTHIARRDFTPGLSDFGLRWHDTAFFLRASDFIPLTNIPRTELAVCNATGRADLARPNQMKAEVGTGSERGQSGTGSVRSIYTKRS